MASSACTWRRIAQGSTRRWRRPEPCRRDAVGLVEQIDRLRSSLGLAPEATGSNNWAVSGARSASGGALMAGDPHLPPSMPGVTYQIGLYVGDRFCRGASFPGRIGIAFGQNNDVAWSFMNVMADVMDLYLERIEALEPHNLPASNLVWADRHGSIGYKLVGRLPIRRGDCPDLPKPGWTGEYEWDGWVPYEELPEATDQEAGFVVTANNKIAPDDFPHHITSDYLDGYRARRIEELIEAKREHDLDSFAAMQTDLLSIPGLKTAHRLARLRPRNQRETAAIERVRSWHGRMSADSIAASI